VRPIHFLRRHPILSKASGDALEALAAASEVRNFEAGGKVVRSGTPQREVLLIAEGKVELSRRNREADTQILVGLLESPAIFGDAELYAKSEWIVTGTASTPVTLVAMPNDAFDRLVGSDGAVAAALYRDACARHMLVIQIMQILALQKTEHQILRLLWGLSEDRGGKRTAPLSQVQLAKALGLNRKTIARNLSGLEEEGLIERSGDEVVLLLPSDYPLWRDLGAHGLGASWQLATDGDD
jgi:CRP-like cAMP-binding protein